jgi:hypothetical protein
MRALVISVVAVKTIQSGRPVRMARARAAAITRPICSSTNVVHPSIIGWLQ